MSLLVDLYPETTLAAKESDDIPPSSEAQYHANEVFQTAKVDMDFFAGLALPLVFKYLFPKVFKSIWDWFLSFLFTERTFAQLAIGLPRGFGKTLVIKLMILYTVCFTKKQFILVICENEKKAISILNDVEDMLNEPNIKAVFGDWTQSIESKTLTSKVFSFRGRSIVIKGMGAGGGVRGITEKNRRPDVMIFDDIQSREDSESEVLSEAIEKWMYSTAMKAKSPEGCLFVFVANMYPTKGSLLRKLKRNPNWLKYIVGGILTNGESLWEELQPIEQLIKEYQNDLMSGHPESFFAEVLNDENAALNNLLDVSKIPEWAYDDNDISMGKFIVIDPSNDKVNSDSVAIGQFEVYEVPALCHLIEERLSPIDIIRKALMLGFQTNTRIICVESNSYQYSLLFWFDYVCQQQGITGFQFLEIYTGIKAKNIRILNMFKLLMPSLVLKEQAIPRVEIGLHPRVRPAVILQATQFNPLKMDNVDNTLDLLTYAPKVMELYGPLILNSGLIATQENDAEEVIMHNTNF